MHIYRRMRQEVRFVLQPDEWSSLIHACISLGQHEYTLEGFREYRVHGIAAFQGRFRLAIRTACRLAQFDTAIGMVHTWVDIEGEQQHDQELEGTSLNSTVWEMLNGSPSRDQVEQVLLFMQTRRCEVGAPIFRPIVAHHFESATEGDEDAVVSGFCELLERVLDTIRRTAFVPHLAMNECASRGWHGQYEHVHVKEAEER